MLVIRSLKQQLCYLCRFGRIGDYTIVSKAAVDKGIAAGVAFLKLLSRQAKNFARIDFTNFVFDSITRLNNQSFQSHPEQAWKMIKCFISIASGNQYGADRGLPILYDEHLVPVATHSRKLEVYFEHVSKLGLADDMSVDQLVQRCTDVGPTAVDFTPKVDNIMGPFEFGSRIARHAGGFKAPFFRAFHA